MKRATLILAAAALWAAPTWADSAADTAREILALERRTMEGWLKGDPGPQLAVCDPEVTYIHSAFGQRIEGLAALTTAFEAFRGTPLFDRYEILDAKVQPAGEVAVLTYRLAQHRGAAVSYWNGTEVYRKTKDGWKVIHAHWSAAKGAQQ